MTMTSYRQDDARGELDSWGKPEEIGAETIHGDIDCAGGITLGGLDKPVFGGEYSATRGRYRVTYAFHEHATLLDGEVALTDVATGDTILYGPGDSWLIAKDTQVVWDIRSDVARKSFLAVTTDI